MSAREITDQILSAWEDPPAEPEQPTAQEPEPESEPEGEPEGEPEDKPEEIVEAGAPDEASLPAAEEPEEKEEGEEETEPQAEPDATSTFTTDNPEAQAILAKYKGNVEQALVGQANLERVMGRQAKELSDLRRRVPELEQQLLQSQSTQPQYALDPQQSAWVESAIESGDPRSYIQAAISEGQFDLARAVCDQWAQESPYDAMRVANQIDIVEANAYATAQVQEPEFVPNPQALLDALVPYFPDLPQHADRMTEIIGKLGDQHPLVADARSTDPDAAVRGVVGILEIARASSTSVSTAREQVKQEQRQKADDARNGAVVSSSRATPAVTEAPRPHRLGPGLTMEDLDAAWDQ
jgi:hypothetical protein